MKHQNKSFWQLPLGALIVNLDAEAYEQWETAKVWRHTFAQRITSLVGDYRRTDKGMLSMTTSEPSHASAIAIWEHL